MKKFLVFAIAIAIAAPAFGLIPNFEGFENPGWAPDTQGSPYATTFSSGTRIVSGGDGLTSFNGQAHLRLTNANTYHGSLITDLFQPWTMECAVYIDIDTDLAPDAATISYLRMNQDVMRNNGYQQSYLLFAVNGDPNAGETWTRMWWDNGDNGLNSYRYLARTRTDAWDIPSSGWYNLQWDFYETGDPLSQDPNVGATHAVARVFDSAGTLLHTFGERGGWLADPGQQTHLGYSVRGGGNVTSIAIDDVQTYWNPIPEPASLSLLALGGLMLLRRRR